MWLSIAQKRSAARIVEVVYTRRTLVKAVDRIQLRSSGIPTDGDQLLWLLRKVFTKREEELDLDSVYGDMVRTYGRIALEMASESRTHETSLRVGQINAQNSRVVTAELRKVA
ncbi:hypothetical protein Trydic_g8500 [Trypoxylus dichotomus]